MRRNILLFQRPGQAKASVRSHSVLCGKQVVGAPKPLKFENMWLQVPNFKDLKDWWNSFTVIGKPGHRLRLKLKHLRDRFSVWNKESFGLVEEKKKNLLEEIHFWDASEEQGILHESQRQMRDLAKRL